MKRAWVVTAFGDIRGFRKWCRNASNTPEIRRPLMRRFLNEVTAFAKDHNCQIKYAGDGFTIIAEFRYSKKKAACIYKFMISLRDLTKRILKIVSDCPWPHPDGFRMRVTGGWVDVYLLVGGPEYIGEAPNLARELLYFDPVIPVIVHASVIKRLTAPQIKDLKAQKIAGKPVKGIRAEDIKELWLTPLT